MVQDLVQPAFQLKFDQTQSMENLYLQRGENFSSALLRLGCRDDILQNHRAGRPYQCG